jgi:SAM-dependent methyltransferase
MHRSSYEHMSELVATYLDGRDELVVADLGSYDVNGSYRPLFDQPGWRYVGVDIERGPNVDVVARRSGRIPLRSQSVDVFVSGQALEHVERFWTVWREMVRCVRPGGLLMLIVPSRGPEHRYPVDCWRFYTDACTAFAKIGDLEVLHSSTDWLPHEDPDSAVWGDTVGVFRRRRDRRTPRATVRRVAYRMLAWSGG